MLYEEIKELFHNKELFSNLISEVDINKIIFHDILSKKWSDNGLIEGNHARIVVINKNLTSHISFSALFKYIYFTGKDGL